MPSNHTLAPGELSLQLEVPVLLPGVDDAKDGCIHRLEERLSAQTGIQRVHLDKDERGKPVLCLHYNPNLVPLEKLERLARDEGAAIVTRFKHETLPIKGMDCASCAASIEHIVGKMPGVLTAAVSYPTQKLKIEYDSTQTSREAIIKTVSKLGYRVPQGTALPMVAPPSAPPAPQTKPHSHEEHEGHDHDEHDHHEGHDHGGHEGHDHSGHNHEAHEPHDEHDHDDHKGHDHGAHGHSHHGHSHGEVDPNAPWFKRNPELTNSLVSGLFLALGFFGEHFFHLPMPVAIAFYAVAYIAGGTDLARHTVPTVLHGRLDVEFLMLLGAIGAAILGDWAEGAFLLFLFSLGHALEGHAMDSARNAIAALGKLTPKTARVKRGSSEVEVPVEQIQLGEVVLVRAGDRLPVDGKILAGHSAIDQSPITGESVPVEKAEGNEVFAGSINGDGTLEIEVTRLSTDSTIARVMNMVEEAQTQKAPSQTFADRFEKTFVPIVLVVVALAAVVPPLLHWLEWRDAIFRAISALVAASPCALALATPSAVLAGIARAAQNGVLIKGGVHLENLGSLQAIAFDKTGTLTRGKPELADIAPADGITNDELLKVAAAVESRSSHPLAQAVVRRATEQNLTLPTVGEVQTLKGKGVQSEVEGALVRIGNVRMMEEANLAIPAPLQAKLKEFGDSGKPTMLVARDQQVLGVLSLADPIRSETKASLQKLRDIGISSLVMLTGDNKQVAQNVAPQVGVTDLRADLLPENKVEVLNDLLKQHGKVAMVGDGVNDAPALANATVGIAMGAGGTDVALETADVALMGDDLSKLPFAVALSRQAKNIIRQNLWISLGVIVILIPCTLFGLARLGVAVVFHEGSTLVVCLNALRLLRFRLRD